MRLVYNYYLKIMDTILQKIKLLAVLTAIVTFAGSCTTMVDGPGYTGTNPYDFVTTVVKIENKSSHEISLVNISHTVIVAFTELSFSDGASKIYDEDNPAATNFCFSLCIPQNESVTYTIYIEIDEVNNFCSKIFKEDCQVVYDSTIAISPKDKTSGEFVPHSILKRNSFENEKCEGFVYTFTDEDYEYAVANGVVIGE